ncbi:MAG: Two-component sensor kinase [Parcubacteria group bacterium GW2011_GWC1_42_11]|uniref:CheA like protein n=1 Tax=Candidatus Nomurabacteria bacterium GW2011_GWC2_42_20 TaxID=1618756 RepID=A0A0G0ZHT2_9BACT|nr:MAG: Two-component sensor kinase [Parcubacteria group bacterium GW2011_GWC1_42_11]KKS48224.1 MAG: CheA like protein [Candidatus Nomurabacteria bacterium GW2011_GWC2_42_20]KKS59354.1 MAG: CheA like protein [Candidatus Nomurabacteria bacterium GW2011_GWA2_42_41]KKT09797.1 MAG: CheA like protein [Candidatus Nomurabacteria bacterium GW2011_GWB1_43_20]
MDEKKRIIIVEDDTVLRDVLAEKLQRSGYVVDIAQDGVIAMERIRAVRPDCILLDILMPRKSGIEVMEEIHADDSLRGLPIIIISNSGQPVEIKRAQELGAKEFLIKAVFDPNEVLEKVRKVLAGSAMAPQGEWGVRTQNVTVSGAVEHPVVENAPVVQAATSVSTATIAEEKIFILVIEDDKFLRELLVRKLSAEGFDVKNAIDAEAAFIILAERKPKIILCDIILPGVDGFEILRRIKEDPKLIDVPVVMLSNLGQKEDLERAMNLGAKDFMVKANFTLDEIVTKVRTLIG